jgi:hypothetical protein
MRKRDFLEPKVSNFSNSRRDIQSESQRFRHVNVRNRGNKSVKQKINDPLFSNDNVSQVKFKNRGMKVIKSLHFEEGSNRKEQFDP